MKNMKKLLVLALVIVSVAAVALPALADTYWQRYGPTDLMRGYGDDNDGFNTDVRHLQEDLNYLGYNAGTVDGIFGGDTEAAVKAFQRANDLVADGIAGPLTKAKLFDARFNR